MSTRSTTHFVHGDHTVAIIYRHYDGYPEGHGIDLRRFFDAVETDTQDTRFGDPAYLAAKLVVYLSRQFATDYSSATGETTSHADERPLDFLGVGICSEDPGDIEYRYIVDSGRRDQYGRPSVRCFERVGWDSPLWREVEIPAEAAV